MATNVITTAMTLLELAKRQDGGKALPIAQNLVRNNNLLQDATFKEANNPGFHKHLRQLALPAGTWRGVGEGVDEGSAQTTVIDEPLVRYEYQNKIDEAAFDMIADAIGMRRQEDMMALEGVGQGVNSGLLYGDGSKGKLNGLFNRYYDATASTGAHLANVIDNAYTAGTGTSVFVCEWGDNGLFLCYPPGSKSMGVKTEDMGRMRVLSAASKPYFAWVTRIYMNLGLCIRDERAVQRIRRIKLSDTTANKGLDDNNIIRALGRLPGMGNAAGTRIYVGRDAKVQMDILAKTQTNMQYKFGEYGGAPVTLFRGIPVRLQEGISETESATLTTAF